MLRILRIVIALAVIIMSAIGLYTGQNNFLPLSQFLLGALLFLIAIEQIKKKGFRNRLYLYCCWSFLLDCSYHYLHKVKL